MVRSSFSILFFIRESKVRKNGNAPIEVIITINGEKCSFSTGKQVHIDKWDKTKQQVKGKDEEAKSLNNYLKAVKAKLYQKEAELLGRGFIITAKLLCEAYQEKIESLKEKSLFEVFTEHNHEQEKLILQPHASYFLTKVYLYPVSEQSCRTRVSPLIDTG